MNPICPSSVVMTTELTSPSKKRLYGVTITSLIVLELTSAIGSLSVIVVISLQHIIKIALHEEVLLGDVIERT